MRDDGAALLGADTPAYPNAQLYLRKKNQSISLTRTIARMRAQKEESEGVQHSLSLPLARRLLDARGAQHEDAVICIGLRYPPSLL